MPKTAEFDWDRANTDHIARHGVTPAEVEQAFANDPLIVLTVQERGGEERVLCAGLTDDGRALQMFTRGAAARFVSSQRIGRKGK